MLRNYLKVALRNLRRHLGSTLVNLSGLAIGVVVCLLFGTLSWSLFTWDAFHPESDRLYHLYFQWETPEGWSTGGTTGGTTLRELKDTYPEVETGTRELSVRQVVSPEDVEDRTASESSGKERRAFEASVDYVDSTFFQVMGFRLKQGDPKTVLDRPNTAVLSQETAQTYFGDANPIGKTLRLDWQSTVTVTGIAKDPPPNTNLNPNVVVNIAHARINDVDHRQESLTDGGGAFLSTYVRLQEGTDPDALETKMNGDFLTEKVGPDAADGRRYRLVGVADVPDVRMNTSTYAYVLLAMALGLLLLAVTNVTNLATARSLERAQETGVRKTIGAGRPQIIRQFLAEAAVLVGCALGLAVVLALLARPLFESLTGVPLPIDAFTDPYTLAVLAGIGLVTALGAGSYPAFVLSQFDPARVLGGSSRGGGHRSGPGAALLRKGLVVFQFATAVVLVAGTIAAYWQLDYLQQASLGFDAEQVVTVPRPPAAESTAVSQTFRREAEQQPGVTAVSQASEPLPGKLQASVGDAFAGLGVPAEERHTLRLVTVGHDFFETLGVRPVVGRTFERGRPADSSAVVLNRAAFEQLAQDLPSGQRFPSEAVERSLDVSVGWLGSRPKVIGIVEDLHLASLHQSIEPMAFFLDPTLHDTYYLRIDATRTSRGLAEVEEVWHQFFPNAPFAYEFADQSFAAAYQADQRTASLVGVFAGLAIFVACLGLFGLAAFAVRQRRHEIGVRKAVGASAEQIIGLLSKDFLRLVGFAIVVALPIAYTALYQWLDTFAYHFDLGPVVFFLAGGGALLVALLTVSTQAFRAARIDPASTLRDE